MMLDKMRKHSRSFIIYIFFGIIIAVFVINFGPQSQGCSAKTTHAGQIAGMPITLNDLTYALGVSGLRGRGIPEDQMVRLRFMVLDRYIVRELLAEFAKQQGLSIPTKEISDMLFRGRYLALGNPQQMIRDDDGQFDYDLFSRYVRYNWGISVKKFQHQQRQELLAEKVRDTLRASIKASEWDAKNDFIHKSTQAQLSYVQFNATDFRDDVAIGDDTLSGFIKDNQARIKAYFDSNKTAYTALPAQVRVRQIRISLGEGANQQAARKKIEAVLRRLRKDERFTDLARGASWNNAPAKGRPIWRNADKPGLGDASKAAVAKLEVGGTSEIVEENGFLSLFKLEGRRKGDQKLEQVQREIAHELLLEQEAMRLAKAAVARHLAQAKAGEKLTDMFAEDDQTDSGDTSASPATQPSAALGSARSGGTVAQPAADSPRKLKTTILFSRSADHLIPGIGISEQISRAAFRLAKGELAKTPFTVGKSAFLISVKDRTDADMDEWKRRKDELVEQFQQLRSAEVVLGLERRLCAQAVKERRLTVNSAVLAPPPADPSEKPGGAAAIPAYVPCQSLQAYQL